jgi:beta-mannosidase
VTTTALAGDRWQLRGCLGREWEWHVGPDEPPDAPGWFPARVPGSVLDDLWRRGQVPDPYYERNSLLVEWVPERAWVYRRWFSLEPLRGGERAVLAFEGVDHAATVYVDGTEVAHNEGMFRPFDVDVIDRVGDGGEHLLAVVVHPAPESEPQVGTTSRVKVHKSRMGYGWDFCPRMVHLGIWRPVTLRVGDPFGSVVVGTKLSDDLSEGTVDVELSGAGGCLLTLLDGGEVVTRGEGSRLEVPSPRLWWPNGAGDQHLYRLRLELDGATRELDVGFRHVDLVPNDGAPADALPYTLTVNGRRLYLNGWNWVPIDALYGVPRPAKLMHLLDLAARANVNLLRVWGGGLIETDEFYDLCDRLGLLVWQDFSMSSSGIESVPSDDPEFVRVMADDARVVVPRRRHHVSLVLWCGGNELDADESTPVLATLRDVVHELDPQRAWLPTSPFGDGQDVHGPWEHQGLRRHYQHYETTTCLLHSEFGVEGMTNRRTHQALVGRRNRWPADRSNPVYTHLGAWWNNAPLVQEAFGGRIGDLETMRRASQHLQYDGLRYAVEANRRRAFRCSGTIPWQFNESYPNAWCTAAVDHRGDPKPAYYGVARAYRPVHVCASFATCAWGADREAHARVWTWGAGESAVARFVDADGTVVSESSTAKIDASLDAFASDLFLLDLELGPDVRNRYVMSRTENLAPLLDLDTAGVDVDLSGGRLRLRHAAGPAALGIVLADARPYEAPGWVVFDDNVIDLLPGESRTIQVDRRDTAGGEILVEGWNLEAQRVG